MKRWSIVTFMAIFLMVSIVSHVGTAEAATSRVAIISKMEGTVEVQKSGGKKTLKGFKGMSLNQGDIVTTGKKSSVVLKFSNGTSEDDTFALESSTKVTFSKLSNKNGTTTKVSMLKGKAWVDVKSIKNKDDEFVLETPTAIMGVRGTNFFVGVDPNTGLPSLAVLSGNVHVSGSGNNSNNNDFSVYPASALTVDNQAGMGIIPIDNQVLAQMLASTSSQVMQMILENAQKIINENQALIGSFTTTTFPTEVQHLPLSEKQYTDNVYNLLLALAEEASKQNKINGNQLLELQQKIKEQQLANNELHKNQGDVDWEFEAKKLSEQQRLEKLKAEQAQKDALKKDFLASEQKAKADKLKQDRLDALEKQWLEKLSQAERDKYERDKQNRLEEQQPDQGNANSGPSGPPRPTDPPTPVDPPTWPNIEEPFKVEFVHNGSPTELIYTRGDGDLFMDLSIDEPIQVGEGAMHLQFGSINPSLEIVEVTFDDSPLDDNGIGDGKFRKGLEYHETELNFFVKVKHNEIADTQVFQLNVSTIVPIVYDEPIHIYQSDDDLDAIDYTITEGDQNFDYFITIDSLDYSDGSTPFIRFEKLNDEDFVMIDVNLGGDEWQGLESSDGMNYRDNLNSSSDSHQYRLEITKSGMTETETYLINIENIQWPITQP